MWVDAAIAARSILCSAGAMASDSAAAPALPSPAASQRAICYESREALRQAQRLFGFPQSLAAGNLRLDILFSAYTFQTEACQCG